MPAGTQPSLHVERRSVASPLLEESRLLGIADRRHPCPMTNRVYETVLFDPLNYLLPLRTLHQPTLPPPIGDTFRRGQSIVVWEQVMRLGINSEQIFSNVSS
jgi:hypothetical protein